MLNCGISINHCLNNKKETLERKASVLTKLGKFAETNYKSGDVSCTSLDFENFFEKSGEVSCT